MKDLGFSLTCLIADWYLPLMAEILHIEK